MSLMNCVEKAGKSFNAEDKAAVFKATRAYMTNEGMEKDAAGIRAIEELIAKLRPELAVAEDAMNVKKVTSTEDHLKNLEVSSGASGSSVTGLATPSSTQLQSSSLDASSDSSGSSGSQIKSTEENTSKAQENPNAGVTRGVDSDVQAASTEVDGSSKEVEAHIGLDALAKKSPEGTSYKSRNLLADFFRQSAKSDLDATQRPLVAVKDFLSNLTDAKALEFLSVPELTKKQSDLLNTFKYTAENWMTFIQGNLMKRPNAEYHYQDMSQFLLQGEGNSIDLEENVKTAIAYAGFSWLAENASRTPFNTDEEINQILDRAETELVSQREREILGEAGTRQNLVVNTLGQRAVQALGLKAAKNAPANLMPRLESDLGAHVFKMLMDAKVIKRTIVTGAEMAEMTGSKNTDANASFQFIKVNPDHPTAIDIVDASIGTAGVLDSLFGVEAGLKEPSLSPIPFSQRSTKNTRQGVPSKLAAIIQAENAVPSFVRQDMWQLAGQVSLETLQEIAGAEHVEGKHAANRIGLEAKNDGLKREITRFKEFVGSMEDIKAGLYFDHTVWKQQRVGIATNVINPQTSKVHRHMLYRQAWTTKVDAKNPEQMEGFFLRVGEGLGVKTDKQSNDQSLPKTLDIMGQPEIVDAVDVLVQMLQGEAMTAAKEATLIAGVKKGGENMHSLDALMALAQYQFALSDGKTEFETQLMGEVDGVTNGPMFSHLLMGAADTVEDLFDLLNRGGFYQEGNDDTQYNEWRGKPGHYDLYETTAGHMTQAVRGMVENGVTNAKGKQIMSAGTAGLVFNAIYGFTGELADTNGTVLKAGRNIIKTPLTAMVFGSAVGKAVQSMADNFVESIYAAIEDTAAGKTGALTREQLIENLNVLLTQGQAPMVALNLTTEKLLTTRFTPDQVKALQLTFKNTLGSAVRSTMEEDFAPFIAKRKQFNETAALTFEMYNAVYTTMREELVDDLVSSGEIAVDGAGNPIHDLTVQQESELRKRLADMAPIMHTAMSQGGDLKAGLYISKSGRKLSTKPVYQGEVKFGTKFSDNGSGSTKANAMETLESAPGVAMAPMSIHSFDSAVMHSAIGKTEALNVHDAMGVGVGGFQAAAQALNQSTWTQALNYSPAGEIYAALERTVQGLAKLSQEGRMPFGVAEKIAQLVADASEKAGLEEASLTGLVALAKDLAHQADDMKLQAMAQMTAIDQYALQGGNYQVSETDRAAAAAKRAELTKEVDAATKKAAKQFEDFIKVQEAKADKTVEVSIEEDTRPLPANPFGKIGPSLIPSDGDLVAFFRKNPTATAKQVLELLTSKLTADTSLPNQAFNLQLVKMIGRAVDPSLPVHFVTGQTTALPGMVPGGDARGWYTVHGGVEGVFVLAPEFQNSGLTVEVLLHELTHAAVTKKIHGNDADMKPHVDELYALLERAKAFVKANKLAEWEYAVSNLDEMIAYGMTSDLFQQRVLAKITMESKVTGFKAFVDKLTAILFGGWAKRPEIGTGMTVLIGNITNLFAQATQAREAAGKSVTLGMAAQKAPLNAINAYSTLEIFDAIDNGSLAPAFQGQLRELLAGMVERLHGPFGAFKEAMRRDEAGNPLSVWLKALGTGKAPFASAILASGFTGNNQQDFVIEQVEATVRAALDANEATTKEAHRQLADLYAETYARIKPADFLGGLFGTRTQAEAQALYDFAFKIEKTNGDRSDYLARFAALGLAHEGFNKLLQVATDRNTKPAALSFTQRLENFFEAVLTFFSRKVTNTYKGMNADAKLSALVEQLVSIEAKKRHNLARQATADVPFMEQVEAKAKEVADKGMTKVMGVLGSKKVRNSSNAFVRAGGALARTVAGGRVDQFLESMTAFRDSQFKGRYGIVAGLINNVKGPVETFKELLLESKKNERVRKQQITLKAKFVLQSFANQGKDLKREDKAAVTAVFLRTGLHTLLDTMSLKDIEQLLADKTALNAEITKLEGQLGQFGKLANALIEDANGLGHYKATGVNKVLSLKMNAHAIARRFGAASTLTDAQVVRAESIIAPLVSLYALRYSAPGVVAKAKEVLAVENARPASEGNGVEFALELQAHLEAESLARLFKGDASLMVHGYTPEIYNYRTLIVTATEQEGKQLLNQGYTQGAQVPLDPADPDQTVKYIFRLADGGMAPHLTGVVGYDGKRAKGTQAHSGYMNSQTTAGQNNQATHNAIASHRAQAQARMANLNPRRDLSKDKGSFMAPVFNEHGQVANWRYLMSESTKDVLLERENSFDKVLGTLAGSIQGKQSTVEQNHTAVATMYAQYQSEYATRGASYVMVGPKSADEDLRNIWLMLPDETKADVRDIWGTDSLMVRSDSLDLMFGYRKLTAADMFNKANTEREYRRDAGLPTNIMALDSIEIHQKLIVGIVETLLAESARFRGMSRADADDYAQRAAMLVSKGERLWQEVVSETKDLLVVKTGTTLAGNILSNFSMLYLHGVPIKDMVTTTIAAFKGATAHRADTEELDRLRTELATGQTQGRDVQIRRRILMLEDAIARNPVTELIEAGLMPTIVEDIAAEEDIYSFKSALTRKVEGVTSKLNPTVVKAARAVYMTHDSALYRGLSHVTQMSDFVARYTLFKHQTTRKVNPLSKQEAILRASDAFVNYDIPMHRGMQYSDDMGFTMFTKYFLYIQRELLRVARENPARVYSMMLLNNFMDLGPIVLESQALGHLGNNPLRDGALGYTGALDKLLTVSSAMALVK